MGNQPIKKQQLRLNQWMQKTTSKVQMEKEKGEKVRNVKSRKQRKLSSEINDRREMFARRSSQSRSFEELEQALKELVDNCVTNNLIVKENATCIHVTGKISSEGVSLTTNNQNKKDLTKKTLPEQNRSQEIANNHPNNKNVQCFNDTGTTANSESINDTENRPISFDKKEKNFSLDGRPDVVDSTSKSRVNLTINTSSNYVNKGLNAVNDESNTSNSISSLKQLPLRRIQSEGDVLDLKLHFNDEDVTEFAATCIRHAQNEHYLYPGESKGNLSCSTGTEDGLCDKRKDHPSLIERPYSLSLPFPSKTEPHEKIHLKNKNIYSQNTPPQPTASLPKSTLSKSPPFRRFPSQPVFYIPNTSDSRQSKATNNDFGSEVGVSDLIFLRFYDREILYYFNYKTLQCICFIIYFSLKHIFVIDMFH
ncbi:uncharacterized protein LOC124447213 isoform X2 [Xenia sp. Carnegie-2017]|uniref:uncharacterized protein LOC124447213 isoform X2 n=1 Tax=Xenia sp. Carnegie-2017 TaxID=2897299 RepID=UPI001F0469BC|nr:uncharacterized protein LOC124447213 isoform X2 [Xenia sp. Carnegie-2017]